MRALTKKVRNGRVTFDPLRVAKEPAKKVSSYVELVKSIAELSYQYKDHIFMFRGQNVDFLDSVGKSTLLPSIYRKNNTLKRLNKSTVAKRFEDLNKAGIKLVTECKEQQKVGRFELEYKQPIQWSILQHYQVCPTPYLDVTQSLRVACSFALYSESSMIINSDTSGYIYVLALPYVTNRISVNSEHDIVTVRLLSISPPAASRPYHQEGYMIGTEFVTDRYINIRTLDFNKRLVAKYKIFSDNFLSRGEQLIPMIVLMPLNDPFINICNNVKSIITAK